MLNDLVYHALRLMAKSPEPPASAEELLTVRNERVGALFGPDFVEQIKGKTVIDFGCGEGGDAVEIAALGAGRVIGLDIQETLLAKARARARAAGLSEQILFTSATHEKADEVISVDAFEHFADPGAILDMMARLLLPGGRAWISFGPPWLHPKGGHLFSVFPWAHLLLPERSLIRWRALYRTDGATRFTEVAGGLNLMTIRRFEHLVAASPFEFESMTAVPIRPLRAIHSRWTREFSTSVVRATLRLKRDVNEVAPRITAVAS